jgi:L-fuconolactonase
MYVQWKSLLEKYMEHFSGEEREKVFGRNAEIFYKLNMLDQ